MSRQRDLRLTVGATVLIAVGVVGAAAAADVSVVAAQPSVSAEPRPLDEQWRQARACWIRLARIDVHSAHQPDIGQLTVDRFLESAHARALVTDLCNLFADQESDDVVPRITVHFVDTVSASYDAPDGTFLPPRAGAENYEVMVRTQYDDAVTDTSVFVFGQYPDNPNCAYIFFYRQAASSMAQTLFHELLHIWFLNKHVGETRRYPTGHRLVSRCEFEDEFLELLNANAAELSTIEGHPPLNFGNQERQGVGPTRVPGMPE